MGACSINNNISALINDYYQQSDSCFENLKKELLSTDKRIKFEEWLVSAFSPGNAIDTDFAWHSRVISMLMANCIASSRDNVSQQEDLLVAQLISKASPLPKKDEGIFVKTARLVHQSANMSLNIKQIARGMDTDMPFTCSILLRRLNPSLILILNTFVEKKDFTALDLVLTKFHKLLKNDLSENFQIFQILVLGLILENETKGLEIIAKTFPKEFSDAIVFQGKDGNTPVHLAFVMKSLESIKFLIDTVPNAFSEALVKRNKRGYTPLILAAVNGTQEIFKLLLEKAPKAFSALLVQDLEGNTPLHYAVSLKFTQIVEFIIEADSSIFSQNLAMQNHNGNTSLDHAIINDMVECLKLFVNAAPQTFSALIKEPSNNVKTPTLLAYKNIETLQLILDKVPDALYITDGNGRWGYFNLKVLSPTNYKKISRNADKCIRKLNHEITNRVKLGHISDLSGYSKITEIATKNEVANINVEGINGPAWYHSFKKDLYKFQEIYPTLLNNTDLKVFHEALSAAVEDINTLEAIQSSKAVFVTTGLPNHHVTVLIWENQFIICNRGSQTRKPIEFFHFEPLKLNEEILNQIKNTRTPEKYDKFYFEELPEKLGFFQTKLDQKLEEYCKELPNQEVGNCGYISPLTGIFALRMLNGLREINKNDNEISNASVESLNNKIIDEAYHWFKTFSNFELLLILGKNLEPLKNNQLLYEPDHNLLVSSILRAHKLNLDSIAQAKLEELTQTYLNYLNVNAQEILKKAIADIKLNPVTDIKLNPVSDLSVASWLSWCTLIALIMLAYEHRNFLIENISRAFNSLFNQPTTGTLR